MSDGVSKTALAMAMSRALHRALAKSPIIDDPVAERYPGVAEYVGWALEHPEKATGLAPLMPLARARFFEECAVVEVIRGVRQIVLLGAGLDTIAYRGGPVLEATKIYEVDKTETLSWKREALAASGVEPPERVRYVDADLATDDLLVSLQRAGFNPEEPAVISWLGVTYYLTASALAATMTAVSGLAPQTVLVLDYFRPRDTWDHGMVNGAEIARSRGEPWLTTFADDELDDFLRGYGFLAEERLTSEAAAVRYPCDVQLAGNTAMAVVRSRR